MRGSSTSKRSRLRGGPRELYWFSPQPGPFRAFDLPDRTVCRFSLVPLTNFRISYQALPAAFGGNAYDLRPDDLTFSLLWHHSSNPICLSAVTTLLGWGARLRNRKRGVE